MEKENIATVVKARQHHIQTPEGSETITETTSITILMQRAKETHIKCYMLAVNYKDKGKLIEILSFLTNENLLYKTRDFSVPVNTALLFLSHLNYRPLEKYIHNKFPKLKFAFVRVNQGNIPKQNYC